MTKYRLSYNLNGFNETIDLSKLDCLKNKDITDIKLIDDFTKSFKSLDELLDFLKRNKVLDKEINKLFITKEKKDKKNNNIIYEKIYEGEFLFFEKDSKYLDISYLYSIIESNMKNGTFIRELSEKLYKKYNSKQYGPNNINSVLLTLMRLGRNVELYGYESLSNNDINEYISCIDNLIILEFFKYDYKNYEFYKKYDNNGNAIINYNNLRSFAVYIIKKMKKDLIRKNYIKEDKILERKYKEDTEHEEFLTYEDFEKSNDEILETYNPDTTEKLDYKDSSTQLPKRELKKELDNIAKKLVIKGDAYH